GVEPDDDRGDAWAVATGQWVHRWLADSVRNDEQRKFVGVDRADEIRERIWKEAREFRERVGALCSGRGKVLPDWWRSGWSNALYIADCLAAKVSDLHDWSEMAVEYSLGEPSLIRLSEKELRKKDTPQRKFRKQLIEGRGVQLALYALAVHALGAEHLRLTLLSPAEQLEPQFHLADVLAQNDFWSELHRIQETGVFGM